MTTDVSAPLPDLDLADQSILTIDTGDAAAVITSIAIHVRQDTPEEDIDKLEDVLLLPRAR
jgi:hypothetical protein